MRHATLVPGFMLDPAGLPRFPSTPSLSVSNGFPPGSVSVSLEHAISGPIIADTFAVTACDSIIDAPLRAGPPSAGSVQFSRVTVLGSVWLRACWRSKIPVLLDRLLVVDRDSSILPSHTACCRMTHPGPDYLSLPAVLSVNEAQTADEKRRLADVFRPRFPPVGTARPVMGS